VGNRPARRGFVGNHRFIEEEDAVETWQIGMMVLGGVLLLLYFKRRSDRISRSS